MKIITDKSLFEGGTILYIDRRAQKTIAALNESFVELLKDKSISRITVKEICESADIYRSTYYRHFSDPHDQALSILKGIYADAKDCIVSHTHKIDTLEGTEKFCRCFYENKKAFLAVIGCISADECSQMIVDMFKYRFLPFMGINNGQFDSESEEYIFDYAISAAQSIIIKWLKNDSDRMTPNDIALFLNRTVFRVFTAEEEVA